jgi:glycosyltransferase involved in cell wall biosynthesis
VAEPRLLFLSPEYPDPEGNGGQVRLFHVSRGLARLGVGVAIVAPGSEESIERGAALDEVGVGLRPIRRPTSRAREALAAIRRDPRVATRALTRSWLAWQTEVYLTEMRPALDDAFGERWDGVVIEHDWALGWASRVPAGLPVGLVFHNLTDRLLTQQAETESGLQGWRARRDATLARRETDRLAPRLSAAFACSQPDADEVRRRWAFDCAVVPNGADVERLGMPITRDEIPGRILFTGTMSYPPNAQAARWFATEVLGQLRSRRPDVSFAIVGRDPPPDVVSLGSLEGVEVAGRVPDLRPWLAEAQVVVAPLLSGGGTKLKVVEAMAAGRPVVATSVGVEGIDGQHGEHLLVADGSDAFAITVEKLLDDRARAARIAARAKALVTERYSWDAAALAMRDGIGRWLAGLPG